MRDSDWSRQISLRSDWSLPRVALYTTNMYIRCNRMFLLMYCNNHFPVNLKEQTLFEVTVPTSVYYQSKLSQKISFFAVGK